MTIPAKQISGENQFILVIQLTLTSFLTAPAMARIQESENPRCLFLSDF